MRLEEIELRKVWLPQRREELEDIPGKIALEYEKIAPSISRGMRVAVAVGSRGITGIDRIVRQVVSCLLSSGAEPFLIPAMGSHGGATAQGQRQVLEEYGITKETMGAPILSSMKVASLGETDEDPHIPVWMDLNAYEADKVIVVNRVKAHTDFHGPHESGIVKMLAIGLGKQAQALEVHRYGADGLKNYIPQISGKVIESGKIAGALAILEDGYDHTADLIFARPDEIFKVDADLLLRSKELMARLPFGKLDVLIVDEMGKNISGTGMDTNVIGRVRIRGQEDGPQNFKQIAVLKLTPESHGNALGVGLADVAPKSLADEIDWGVTYENVLTSGFLERGFLPVVAQDERQAIQTAIRVSGVRDAGKLKMARIKNTLNLDEIYVSRPLWAELDGVKGARPLGEWSKLEFTEGNRIKEF